MLLHVNREEVFFNGFGAGLVDATLSKLVTSERDQMIGLGDQRGVLDATGNIDGHYTFIFQKVQNLWLDNALLSIAISLHLKSCLEICRRSPRVDCTMKVYGDAVTGARSDFIHIF